MLTCHHFPSRTEIDWLTGFVSYGPRWQQHRRLMHSTMAPDIVPQYAAIQIGVTRGFLCALLRDPQDLASHIKL